MTGRAAPPPILRLEEVRFAYPAGPGESPRLALDGVSLDVQPGEYLAVLGHNGSGKSTLAKLLNALLVPTSGRVLVEGRDTREAVRTPSALRTIRQAVGLVFQNPDNQIVATIVEEDVAFGPENLGLPRDEIVRRVDAALSAVEMEALRTRPPHHLSGGQRQRVAIAGILAMRPRVLVLDEATAMLDPHARRDVLATARRLHQAGTTVVQVTHFMAEAAQAQRVVVLDAGRVALDAPPGELFQQVERLRALRLDVPPLTEVAERLRVEMPWLPAGVVTTQALAEAVLNASSRGGPRDVEEGARRTVTPPSGGRARVGPSSEHPPPTRQPIIMVDGLRHTYMAGTPLAAASLAGVDFRLEAGERAGIIGATGSGKSTLVQHLNGLIRPQQGRVLVAGQDLGRADADVRAVRRTVSLVFQFPEQQLFEATVGDDVAFAPRQQKLPLEQVRQRVRDAMEAVGLPFEGFKDRYTFGLSGGEMRRVAIAGALAVGPRVLVLDEPTAGLDPRGRDDLLDLLLALNREQGMGLVFVSHNMDETAALVERVWVLSDGRTLVAGPAREVFGHAELLRQHGLDVPEVTTLAGMLARGGATVTPDWLTTDEAVEGIRAWTSSGC